MWSRFIPGNISGYFKTKYSTEEKLFTNHFSKSSQVALSSSSSFRGHFSRYSVALMKKALAALKKVVCWYREMSPSLRSLWTVCLVTYLITKLLVTWLALSLKSTDSKPSSFFRPSSITAGLINFARMFFRSFSNCGGLRVPLSEGTDYSE